MSVDLSYKISFTDTSKTPIVIQPNSRNYDTTLVLFGRSTTDWGYDFNTNLIRLLENFSNEYLPGYAGQVLEGQLWYNSDTKQLNLCTKSTKDQIVDGVSTQAALEWVPLTNVPSPELTGLVTLDSLEKSLAHYIPITGNHINMVGSLLVSSVGASSDPLAVATKKYVDSVVCACANKSDSLLSDYVSDTGSETSTTITLFDDQSSVSYAAPKKYVDLKRKISYMGAPDLVISNASQSVIGLEMTSTSEPGITYVNYNGYITIPGTTSTGDIECVCALPYELEANYFVTVSSKLVNGLDTPGTTNTGSAGDAYVVLTSTSAFSIKCTAKTVDTIVNLSVNGIKSTGATVTNYPIQGTLSFNGNAEVGQVLTTVLTGVNDDNGLSGTPTYKWYRDTTLIPSATSSTYTIVQADLNVYIRCEVTYIDDAGYSETLSASIGPITAATDYLPVGSLVVSGQALSGVGQTPAGTILTATLNVTDADGFDMADVYYNWVINGQSVGVTYHPNNQYTMTANDVGKTLICTAGYTDHANHQDFVSSGVVTL